ncbi:MAG TPA: TonB-dependent receptor [Polyangiaceae bacterium]|nr:TonB-dependent receptor [Polyangiaceae bacterium]
MTALGGAAQAQEPANGAPSDPSAPAVGAAGATPAPSPEGGQPPPPAESSSSDTGEAQTEQLSGVVVTGTRRSTRTEFDSSAPIDVVTAADLGTVPSRDLNDKLAATVPSFNVQRLPLADGAIFNRPATLRGLSPDQTLVLINGKRRHRSAYIDVTAQGSQAVDLNEIPLAAIERVEVLRDGASAQYGSDAIAGVINIILKDKPGASGYLQGSVYQEGDGGSYLAGINGGWALGKRGSLNLTLEGGAGNATSRSNQRPNAQALIDNGNIYVKRPAVQRFGQPDTRNFIAFVNSKYQLADSAEAYLFGNFGYHWGENDFNYRNPTQGSVFTSTQPPDVFNANFATLPKVYQDWYNNNPAVQAGYPGGFTPRFSATSLDGSAVAGVRGDITPDLTWDLSGRYGVNHIDYYLRDTINASQGPTSLKAFNTGTKQQTEYGANLDFNYSLPAGLKDPINVAFGGEFRRESYKVGKGQPDSYAIGPLGAIGLAGGANGFFGTGPNQAGTWGRNSVAGYVDVDADLTRRFNVGGAGRAEHYSDAGSALTGKVSSRITVIDQLNLRGALSTGFRAPTPGQSNLTNTNQFPSPDGSSIQTNGTIPPTNPISALKGGEALKPEKSVNISFGFVTQPLKKLSFSADVYRIDIRDRIGLSQRYTLTAEEQADLVAGGVAAAQGLTSFNFFVNGYKTRTQGLDLVLSYGIDLSRNSQLNITGAANFNKTKVQSFEAGVIDARQRQYIEDRLPQRVTVLSIEYVHGPASILARARDYSSWTEPLDPTTDASGALIYNQKFSEEVFFDLAASYGITMNARLTLGAENIFNNYPDKAKYPNTQEAAASGAIPSNGRIYPSQRPYESDGARYYARLNFDF